MTDRTRLSPVRTDQPARTEQRSGLRALKGERSFRQVRRQGLTLRSALFTLRVTPYRPAHGEPYRPAPEVGIVVPKKTLRLAVSRNRARRRVREALRTLKLPPCRAVLMPSPACLDVPFGELQAALAGAFADAEARKFRPRKAAARQETPRQASQPHPESR